ncbi:MAG: CvpA family protein [Chloroflexota bacterium]|nr:CvpA family protein [Chloroflexota bacterium]MDE3193932.1 CvpA family protein [Chloroflexota bacterium]
MLALAIVAGIRAGFIATLYGLVSWLLSLVLAFALLTPVSDELVRVTGMAAPTGRAIAFVVVLLVVEGVFSVVGRVVVWPLVQIVHATAVGRALDRALGIFPSILRALLITAIGLAALVVLPVGNDVRSAIDGSRLGSALVSGVASAQPYLGQLLGTEGGSLFVTKIDEGQQQQLDLPSDLPLEPDPQAEEQMLEFVNQQRASVGLSPLALDPRLVPIARQHSEEMFRLKYFGHQSPVTGSPFDRLDAAGIRYSRAGENLAYARSVAVADAGLMASQGHRENILRPEFTRVGIGVIDAGPYGKMFTQMFITPP